MGPISNFCKPASAALILLVGAFLFGCASTSGSTSLAINPGLKDHRQADRLLAAMRNGASQTGLASWYGAQFHGRRTANGEVFDMDGISAAHKTLPFGTMLEVSNLDNGRKLKVRVNDRGPFIRGRILDLSRGAAKRIGLISAGVARVEIRLIGEPHAARKPSGAPPQDLKRSPSGEGRWVQAGAFRDQDRARAFAQSLRKEDPRFTVFSADGWHRVQARLNSSKEAHKLVERLRRRSIKAVVVPAPP